MKAKLKRRDAETQSDKTRCEICGKIYDRRFLDEVIFHNDDHKPFIATGIKGKRIA